MTYCQADLLAITWMESRFDCSVIGDNGHSRGCAQIYDIAHPWVKHEEAFDYRWSMAFTINRLVQYRWVPRTYNGKNNRYAISKHNGTGTQAWNYALNAVGMSNLFIKEYNF